MGTLSQQQLLEQIDLLYKLGEDYFKPALIESESDEDAMIEHQFAEKGFDFPVIDKLVEQFAFKLFRIVHHVLLEFTFRINLSYIFYYVGKK